MDSESGVFCEVRASEISPCGTKSFHLQFGEADIILSSRYERTWIILIFYAESLLLELLDKCIQSSKS